MKVPQSLGPARKILDVLKHHDCKAGEGLPKRVFLIHFAKLGLQPSDLDDAIQAAKDAEYVVDGPSGGLLVTEAGRRAYPR